MKTGIELIAEERQNQLEKHGRSLESDRNNNSHGEMKQVARYLLGIANNREYPRNWDSQYQYKLDRKSELNKLIIAGALIAAEIDRISKTQP